MIACHQCGLVASEIETTGKTSISLEQDSSVSALYRSLTKIAEFKVMEMGQALLYYFTTHVSAVSRFSPDLNHRH